MAPPARGERYLPAEDTYLLREALRPCSGGACLEIGFGSGAVVSSLAERFRLAVGTDIMDLGQARLARGPLVDLVIADRARCFRDGSFGLVFFNPPYVPSEVVEDRAVDGGPTGIEVPTAFLEEGARVLQDGGVMMVLLSDRGDVTGFLERCKGMGFEVSQAAQRKIFYENLFVFRLEKGDAGKAKAPP